MPRPSRQLSEAEYAALRARFSADDYNYDFLNASHPVFGRRGSGTATMPASSTCDRQIT